jgi:hypothetical protein
MAGLFCYFFKDNLINTFHFKGINSPSLTLQTIKRNDEGEYTCLTSNSIGRGQASVNIRVQCKINISSKEGKKKFLF